MSTIPDYRRGSIQKAEGNAQQTIQQAEAFKASRVAQARGEATGFLEVLQEYSKSKEVTRTRLYLEEIEKVLSGVKIYVVDENTGGVLPFLPLTDGAAASVGGGS